MKSNAVYLIGHLIALGNLTSAGQWSGHVGEEPVRPINCVTIYDTNTRPPIVLSDKYKEEETIQVRIRSEYYTDGWEKAKELENILDYIRNLSISVAIYPNVRYVYYNLIRYFGTSYIGKDGTSHNLFTINYKINRIEVEVV